jgi:prepilin-type N-terminal cleavage/methylation domain-containing protein
LKPKETKGNQMGILKQKGVKELNMAMGIKRKKGFNLVEVIIATSIITFIIFAVMEVYYVNKKAEEQKRNQRKSKGTNRNQLKPIETKGNQRKPEEIKGK